MSNAYLGNNGPRYLEEAKHPGVFHASEDKWDKEDHANILVYLGKTNNNVTLGSSRHLILEHTFYLNLDS